MGSPLGQDGVNGVGVGSACHDLHGAHNTQASCGIQHSVKLTCLRGGARVLQLNALQGPGGPEPPSTGVELAWAVPLPTKLKTVRTRATAPNHLPQVWPTTCSATEPSSQHQVEGVTGTAVIWSSICVDIVGNSATVATVLHVHKTGCRKTIRQIRGLNAHLKILAGLAPSLAIAGVPLTSRDLRTVVKMIRILGCERAFRSAAGVASIQPGRCSFRAQCAKQYRQRVGDAVMPGT